MYRPQTIISLLLLVALLCYSLSPALAGEVTHSETCTERQFPLHYAIWKKDDSKAQELIKRRKHINVPCYVNDLHFGDTTPLMVAVQKGNVELIRLLIRNGVDVLGDPYNKKALHIVASSYDLEDRADIAQILLDAGADMTVDDFGTPLSLAAERGYIRIAQLLISKGVNPNVRSKYGTTPLYAAGQADQLEMSKFLVSVGATISEEDFLTAASNGNLLVLHFFLKGGGNVNVRGVYGITALHRSAQHLYGKFRECAELLLQKGADINAKNSGNMTPLHIALRSREFHPYSGTWFVENLIARGANLNVKDNGGDTPLDIAQEANLDSIVKILKSAGAKNSWQISASTN